jgi:hypothetical protein
MTVGSISTRERKNAASSKAQPVSLRQFNIIILYRVIQEEKSNFVR